MSQINEKKTVPRSNNQRENIRFSCFVAFDEMHDAVELI